MSAVQERQNRRTHRKSSWSTKRRRHCDRLRRWIHSFEATAGNESWACAPSATYTLKSQSQPLSWLLNDFIVGEIQWCSSTPTLFLIDCMNTECTQFCYFFKTKSATDQPESFTALDAHMERNRIAIRHRAKFISHDLALCRDL